MAVLRTDCEDFTTETRDASPAHLLVKIESFSLLSECGLEKYESREFVAGDYKWRLIIYPDGHRSEREGKHVSVYLAMVGTSSLPVDWEINAVFTIFLYNKIFDNYLCFRGKVRRFHAMQSEWGFSKMISKRSLTDESNGFLVDDKCVFGAEVFVIKSQRVVECVSLLKVPSPYKRDWKIEKFSKLRNVWTSEEFKTGDHKWKIFLYPDGDTEEKGRSVSIYLECVDSESFAPNEKVRADYCINLKNHIQSTEKSLNGSDWFTSSSTSWGRSAFIPIAVMRKDFIVDDCCSLHIEISVRAVVRNSPSTPN
ncbi:hypothetical protein DH2020_049489 [Rehmannia glutinosa]|uniref:MATH domain-containing protein n=1 Tax=Rehmannia glutinosa TaxID=99300 RepID=A0ABR0U3H5_REHGL